jgi:hypothetical protein
MCGDRWALILVTHVSSVSEVGGSVSARVLLLPTAATTAAATTTTTTASITAAGLLKVAVRVATGASLVAHELGEAGQGGIAHAVLAVVLGVVVVPAAHDAFQVVRRARWCGPMEGQDWEAAFGLGCWQILRQAALH